MAVFRGLKVDVRLLGWVCYYYIVLRGAIIVHHYLRMFRWTGYKLCVLLLYFGNVRFSREQALKLYRVPYQQRIQHSLHLHR